MYKGDLSNELTKRVLVTLDTIRVEEVEVGKVLLFIPKVKKNYKYDRQLISRMYLLADRSNYTLELVAFGMSETDLAEEVERLDDMGTNPFRYHSAYKNVSALVDDLPYRPEVMGVLDIPENLLRYGHWGWDFGRLA